MATPSKESEVITLELGDHVKLWQALKLGFIHLRGSTPGPNNKAIPRTTNRDVLLLVTRWSTELMKASGDEDRDRLERARWKVCVEEANGGTKTALPAAEYPNNPGFWAASQRLSIYLESLKLRPSKWELAAESLSEAVTEIPTTLGRAGKATAGAVVSFFGSPLKLAAAVVGGAVVLPLLVRGLRK